MSDDSLYCRLCAAGGRLEKGKTLSQKFENDGVSELTEVDVVVTDTKRGYSCEECGGLTGVAVRIEEGIETVGISEHPAPLGSRLS